MTLTSEEYRAIRTTLGLTQEEAMRFHKLKNVRTIKRWESGAHVTSESACQNIIQLFKRVNEAVNRITDGLKDSFDATPREEWSPAVLIQFSEADFKKYLSEFEKMPVNIHKAIVHRIYTELSECGYPVGIISFNEEKYNEFLCTYGLTDSEEARALWATSAYSACP